MAKHLGAQHIHVKSVQKNNTCYHLCFNFRPTKYNYLSGQLSFLKLMDYIVTFRHCILEAFDCFPQGERN